MAGMRGRVHRAGIERADRVEGDVFRSENSNGTAAAHLALLQ